MSDSDRLAGGYDRPGFCPVCERPTRFRSPDDLYRTHLQCAQCGSLPHERALAMILARRRPGWRGQRLHELAPGGSALSRKLQRECAAYTGRSEDPEARAFPDQFFELVIALDVLQQCERPDRALSEAARTLRPGGAILFTLPAGHETLGRPERIHAWSGLDVEVTRFHDPTHGIVGEFTDVYVARSWPSPTRKARPPTEPSAAGPQDVRRLCEAAAQAVGVSADVHAGDAIFRFIWEHPSFASKEAAVRYYFTDGARSAAQVRAIVDRWMPGTPPLEILEFASGYGAVTRHARTALAPHRLTACDIHPAANAFNARTFSIPTIQSATVPEELALPQAFDVIFVLSFFSHMPRATWTRWLQRLYRAVRPGGLLLFTTHGLASMAQMGGKPLDADGFWFEAGSEQHDLDGADYGQTVTSREFVDAQIATLPGVECVQYEPGYWWGHQDLFVLRRG